MSYDSGDLTLHQKYAIMYMNMKRSAKDPRTKAFLKRRMRAEKRIASLLRVKGSE